ncbi:MAG: hypothetical protein NZ700_12360 [Gemmataceae bacterium]|nr:hypothetical protein [Gemmataceae bacterium]MDW8266770.1 hypothetical protein [Gemmataceae bacterium]
MKPRRSFLFASGVVAWVLVLAGPGRAAEPCAELLRLVPDDVGLCFVIRDLRNYSQLLRDAPFWADFRQSPLGKELVDSPEIRKLGRALEQVSEHLGISWERLRDDILGDAIVLAYRPGPPDRPELEEGMILVHARDPQLLRQLVNRLDQLQRASGELKELQPRSAHGRDYVRRIKTKGEDFLFVHGSVLVLSGQETLLRRALERDRTMPPADQEVPLIAAQLEKLKAGSALAAVWLNPRAFDAAFQRRAAAATADDRAFLTAFGRYWKALEGVVAYAQPAAHLEIGLSLRVDWQQLPESARRLFSTASQPSPLWQVFPEDALLAAAVQIDWLAAVQTLGEFLPESVRGTIQGTAKRIAGPALGRDIAKEVLPYLGPECGVCIVAPPRTDRDWFPQMVSALRVRDDGPGAPLSSTLLAGLHSLAVLAVLDYNSKHPTQAVLRSSLQGKVEVRSLVHPSLPSGWQLSFAFKEGYLLLASSPDAIQRFSAPKNSTPSSAADEVPLLRISVTALRAYLRERQGALVPFLATQRQISRDEAQQQLERWYAALQWVDRIEITQQASSNQVTFRLRLHTSQRLVK